MTAKIQYLASLQRTIYPIPEDAAKAQKERYIYFKEKISKIE